MKQTIGIQIGIFFVASLLVFGFALMPAYAHEGEDHADAEESVEAKNARLEKMIELLKDLVVILTQLRTQQGMGSTIPAVVVPDLHDHEAMDEHHDDMMSDDSTSSVTELVIEVETHHEDTHVHVRYVDKPEEMFFVEADITNEDALVGDISAHTGLSADEVKGALKYMQ